MVSSSIGPFKGKVFLSDCDTATLVISHVWAPFRSLAEISMDVSFNLCTEADVQSSILWWLAAGENDILNDFRALGLIPSTGNEPIDEDGPDEYTEVD